MIIIEVYCAIFISLSSLKNIFKMKLSLLIGHATAFDLVV